MKLLFTTSLLLLSLTIKAQSLAGKWDGHLTATGGTVQANIQLQVESNQVSGVLTVTKDGMNEIYKVNGKTNGNYAKGSLSLNSISAFGFEMQLEEARLAVVLNYIGQPIFEGIFMRSNGKSSTSKSNSTLSNGTTKPDNLYRDPALIGGWRTSQNYSSGSFYGGSSSIIIFYADGRLGDGESTSHFGGDGVSGISRGNGQSSVSQNERWFTKGNIIYLRVKANGASQDLPMSRYYIENGKMLIRDLKTEGKTLYYKTD